MELSAVVWRMTMSLCRIHRITTLVLFLHGFAPLLKIPYNKNTMIVHGNLQLMPHKVKTKEGQGIAKAKALKAKAKAKD